MKDHEDSMPLANWLYLAKWARMGRTTPAKRLILRELYDLFRRYGGNVHPGVRHLADAADCDPRTAKRHLRELEAQGWFTRTRGAGWTKRGYFYHLTLAPWMQQPDFHARVACMRYLGMLRGRRDLDENWPNWGDTPDLVRQARSAGATDEDFAEYGISQEELELLELDG